MAKNTSRRDGKQDGRAAGQRPKPKGSSQAKQQDNEPKLDIVEEAGKESFPASDAPSWNP